MNIPDLQATYIIYFAGFKCMPTGKIKKIEKNNAAVWIKLSKIYAKKEKCFTGENLQKRPV